MRFLFLLMLFPGVVFATFSPTKNVDFKQFSGLWYEIARTYNDYQKTCVASSVEYVPKSDQKYNVYNRCFDSVIGGDLIEYKGVAKAVEKDSVSTLDMTYFWFFTKRYHVFYIDENYTSAVVTDEAFKQVWIMSRKPTMKEEKLQKILALLAPHLALENLIYTKQDPEGRYR